MYYVKPKVATSLSEFCFALFFEAIIDLARNNVRWILKYEIELLSKGILFVSTGVSIQRSPHLSLKFTWKVASVDIPAIPNYFIYY